MTSCLSFLVVLVAASMAISSARVIPAEPLSIMMDSYGNPVMFLREKRAPVKPYPHRAMMFTGYYRPARRSDDGAEATGVYAQGNAVSGGTYLADIQPTYLKDGPEPIDEPEVSSAEAEASPALDEPHRYDQGEQEQEPLPIQSDVPVVYATEAPAAAPEEPAAAEPETPVTQKPQVTKKGKKTPVDVPAEEEEDDDEFEDDEPAVPFVPVKGNRRQGYVPNLNNFFPMMFSFPGAGNRRGGSSGTPPGIVTAIANSYSTGKGGVASSVATAYGGAPNGKKARRAPAAEE